jgi:DNA primase
LYGISQAKESIREKESVILVEGYADLISISQAGFLNVVASSGTALTSEQVQLIGRYTRNITFVYDADSAGQSAMIRGVDTILEGGLDVRVAELPQGEDPDSFVRTHGKAALNELLSKAVSFIDFKAGVFQREGKFNSPEGKAEVVRQLIQTIAKISDQLKRSFFIKDIATKYGLYESALLQELEKTRGKVPIPVPMITKAQSIQQEKKSESLSRAAEIPIEEKEILTVLLTDAVQFMPAITSVITANDLTHPIAREAFNLIVDEYDVSGIIEVLEMIKRPISDDVRILMQDLTFSRYSLSAKWDGIGPRAGTASLWERAEGAVKRLKKKVLQKSLEENQQKMKNASLTGAETMPLLKQHQSIISELKDIESMKLKDPSSESTQEVED